MSLEIYLDIREEKIGMRVRKNIGILNALIRITIGLTVLSWFSAKYVRKPWENSYLFIMICGAMKVAEGIVQFCPLTALYEKCQEEMDSKRISSHEGEEDSDIMEAYNPT